jgi:cobalamin biosynthesis protein CbiG
VNDPVIVALTPNGITLGTKLVHAFGRGEVVDAQGSARRVLQKLFKAGRPLVCVMALGIVVRILGPLARHKDSDPPVIAVDEAGKFAISVLGGHAGRANALAKQVAEALGAQPVITTASDSLGLPHVGLIGQDWGWRIEPRDNLTKVAAAVVRGEPVGIYQDAGRHDWWQAFGEWPANFLRIEAWPPVDHWAGLLVISDRLLPIPALSPVVVYRPPTLVVGTGCRRRVPCEEIELLFELVCARHEFAPLSLGLVATASLKAGEPGLQEFATKHNVPLLSFDSEELARVEPLPSPSERVRARIGIAGVAEPAAMLAAGTDRLLVTKVRGPRVTMALARREA